MIRPKRATAPSHSWNSMKQQSVACTVDVFDRIHSVGISPPPLRGAIFTSQASRLRTAARRQRSQARCSISQPGWRTEDHSHTGCSSLLGFILQGRSDSDSQIPKQLQWNTSPLLILKFGRVGRHARAVDAVRIDSLIKSSKRRNAWKDF